MTLALWKQAVVSAALAGLAAAGWHNRDAVLSRFGAASAVPRAEARGAASPGVPVIVEPVRLAEDDLRLEVVGTGRARRSVTLRSRASGEIVSMALAPGARVEAGEVLMRLDDADERLALSLAETRLADARRTLERQRQLRASGTAALARLDEAETAAEIARLEVERAREALAERSLLAPFDGVAGLPEVETGAWVEEGEAIASLDDRSALLVEIDLPEAALGRLGAVSGGGDGLAAAGADVRSDAAGGAARIGAVTPTVPGRVFGAALEAVDSRVDPGSRTVRVRVAVPNENDALRPGASFTVRLDLPGGRYPVVPELALQFSRGSLHVWRLAGEAAERVEVVMIRRRDRTVLVDGPLAEGDRVVVEGTQRLRPGRAVRVLRDGAGGET